MSQAAVIDLEVYKKAQAEQMIRQSVHQALDMFMDQVEEDIGSKGFPPRLEDMTGAVLQHRSQLTAAVVKAFVEKNYRHLMNQQYADCPHCGKSLKSREMRHRTVETMVGEVSLMRPYFYCHHCGVGFAPLDEVLGLSGGRKQYDVQAAGTRLASEMPYEDAEDLLRELTDARMSDCELHEVLNAVADGLDVLDVSPTAEEIAQKVEKVAHNQKRKPIVVLSVDGADVPTRPEEAKGRRPGRKRKRAHRACWEGCYRESKGFRFFLVDGERIVHLLSWHQVQTEKQLAEALGKVKEAGLIPEESVRLCGIGDGASWIWKRVEEFFPTARQILDFYHCSGYLHRVAATQYSQAPERGQEWLEATLARLFHNEVHEVLLGLQRMSPADSEAQEAIGKCLRYLETHKGRLNYGSARRGGYPIGSGGIESAHKFIGHVRLKRSGAWWYVENSNRMLALRCAKYNGTFHRVFRRYVEKTRSEIYKGRD